jgi:aspartyl-tRNA(Asn)/glutamyl-tRNA(Gln) amidotransferase subunit C
VTALSTQYTALEFAMSLSRKEVEHVAYLARIGLSEEEKDRFQEQLSSILEHVAVINQLDTEAIPPTAQVIPLQNIVRMDTPLPSFPAEAILANAPRAEGGYFKIPPVLDEQ